MRADKFLELARLYTDFTALTAPILHAFVDRVVIHEADKSSVSPYKTTFYYEQLMTQHNGEIV